MLVHLIADYGAGDLAFAEVSQRLALALPGAQVHATPVAAFDTLAAGFCVAQLALTEGPSDRLVIHNVAPRRDQPGPRPANEGERFCVGRTTGGVLVVGPNSGFSFSFCAPELKSFCYLAVPAGGSQFRSRDLLPPVLPAVLAGDGDVVAGNVPPERVPEPSESVIAYVDGYGNLKTTVDDAPAPPGAEFWCGSDRCPPPRSSATARSPLPKASSRWPRDRPAGPRVRAVGAPSTSCFFAAGAPPSDSPARHRERGSVSSGSMARHTMLTPGWRKVWLEKLGAGG